MTTGAGMPDYGTVRVGDVERNSAITALGEHMTAGRLDIDEYGRRSAEANSARTVTDLQQLFVDLPAPHPAMPGGITPLAAPAAALQHGQGAIPAPSAPAEMTKVQKVAAGLAGAGSLVAVALFFILTSAGVAQAWLVFLLIPIMYSIGTAVWGPDWRGPRR